MGAHEMAHIKRGDVALFALCSVAKAVFWFNPFMHQICARATLAAEQGADALVLARGVDRRQYAHCFVQGLRLAANSRYGSFAGELIPSFTPFDKRSRRQRLDAILSGVADRPALTLTTKIGLGAGAAIAAALAVAQAAFAVAPGSIEEALPVIPVEGEITLAFGDKDKLLGKDRVAHEGIDISAARGEAVRASGAGKVIDATDLYRGAKAWGKVVVIDHGHGLVTRYAHLDSYKVRKGDNVAAGDVIGAVGSTGVASGPHLHYEVIVDGETVDPATVSAPAPAAAPSKKASTSTRRSVQVAAAPAALAAPAPEATPEDAEARRKEKIAHKLEAKQARLEQHMRKMFAEFDAFKDLEGKTLRLNELDLQGFEGAQQFAEMFDGKEFDLSDFSNLHFQTPDMSRLFASAKWSEEDMQAWQETREEAMDAYAEAMALARESIEDSRQARIEAKAEAEEALAEAKRDMKENARERKEAQKERERAMRETERERRAAQREAERERERAEADWQAEYESMVSEEEMLAMREEAAREAKRDLEREIAEIEQRRKELERSAARRD
jgi:murein DD-endopeptidase MepM/ murein hydrolase activator NlpD